MKLFVSCFLLLIVTNNSAIAGFLNCPCKVVKITDGDTVNVIDQLNKNHKIRLGGIDAPEKKQAFGQKSKQNLSTMVAGQFIEVEFNKRDKYGRILGKLLKDGQDINLKQVTQGFAWHYKHYQNEQSSLDRALYAAAETDARKKRIGLWSVPAIAPWEYRRATRKHK